jgi:hypothetical protein
MKTITEVRTKVVELLKTVKIANGYLNDLPDNKVYGRWIQAEIDNTKDTAYPRAFVCIENGKSDLLVGDDQSQTLNFVIIVMVRKAANQDCQALLESFLVDLEKLFLENNNSLDGFVNSVRISEFALDGGVRDPEGVLMLQLVTERQSNG